MVSALKADPAKTASLAESLSNWSGNSKAEYLCAVVLGGALSTLARHWSWPFLDLPIAFWRGLLQTSAAILPGAVPGSAVCAGGISNPRKPKA